MESRQLVFMEVNKIMDKKGIGFNVGLSFALYMILPSYFALEISNSIPLLTVSRFLLLFTIIFYLCRKSGKVSMKISDNRLVTQGLITYAALLIIVNMVFIAQTSEAAKTIFTIVFEEISLVWILTRLINTRQKLVKCIQVMVYASGIVAVLAIFETFSGLNIFYYMNTVQREMLMASVSRMGLARAEAGFGHAVYYGTYCAVMVPVCMYFIELNDSKKIRYSFCLSLNIIGLLLANSRGALIAFACILLFMLVTKKKKELDKYKKYIITLAAILTLTAILKPSVVIFLAGIIQSLLDSFSTGSTSVLNYGTNAAGLSSRLGQLSGIIWTLQNSPVWGFGANANTRGMVSYLNIMGTWATTNTFDIGYVGIFCQYGIIGSLGYLALFGSMIKVSFSKKYDDKSGLLKMFKYVFITYLLCLISVSQVHKLLWTQIGLFVCYLNIMNRETM